MSEALGADLSASLEDYLEAIFHLSAHGQKAKATDIARRLKVRRPSVTGALRALARRSLVDYSPYAPITLTEKGRKAALEVVRKHEILRDFLVKVLSVDPGEAEAAACRMEHCIPRSIVDRFVDFAEFMDICPRAGRKWIAGFGYQCARGMDYDACERCIARTLVDVRELKAKRGGQTVPVISLRDLRPGERGKVARVGSGGALSRRVREMGMTPGTLVQVERVAPLGDPVEIKLRGYHLTLRKDEAGEIQVERV
jgi:DtxR family Mn-dependent transcriptional regulator